MEPLITSLKNQKVAAHSGESVRCCIQKTLTADDVTGFERSDKFRYVLIELLTEATLRCDGCRIIQFAISLNIPHNLAFAALFRMI